MCDCLPLTSLSFGISNKWTVDVDKEMTQEEHRPHSAIRTAGIPFVEHLINFALSVFLVLAPYIWLTGGFRLEAGFIRISATSVWWIFAVPALLAVAKWTILRLQQRRFDWKKVWGSDLLPSLKRVLELGIIVHLILIAAAGFYGDASGTFQSPSRLTAFLLMLLSRALLHRSVDRSRILTIAAMLVTGFTIVRWFAFIHAYSVNILFSDQWDLYDAFFKDTGLWDLFLWQHGPHRQGLGFLLTQWIVSASGWNTVVESFAVGGTIFLASVLAIVLKRRLFGPLVWTDAAVPLMFLTVAQYETLVGTPNLSHGPFPLLLIVLYCLCLTLTNIGFRYALLVGLNFVLIYTGFGLFMGIISPVVFLSELFMSFKENRRRQALMAGIACVLSVGSLLSFFIDYRWLPAAEDFHFPQSSLWHYALYVFSTLSNFLGFKTIHWFSVAAGGGICLAMIGILIQEGYAVLKNRRPEEQDDRHRTIGLIVLTLISFTLIFCTNAAIGRISRGLSTAMASRYVVYLIPGFFGVFLFLHRMKGRKQQILLSVFALWMGAASLPMHAKDMSVTRWLCNGKHSWIHYYLETGSAEIATRKSGFQLHPRPKQLKIQKKLDYFETHGLNLFVDRKRSHPDKE